MKPQRVVFDSLAEIRLLAGSPLRFRRQVMALKQYFIGRGMTVLLLDESQAADEGLHVHTIVHGVIELEQLRPEYGGDRRRLRVSKFRGRAIPRRLPRLPDRHRRRAWCIPRLVAAHYRREGENAPVSSGLPALDALLGGGLDRGTSTLFIGAAGTGKSSLAAQFVMAAAERGERSAMFLFDESVRTLITRSRGIGFDLERRIAMPAWSRCSRSTRPNCRPGEFIQWHPRGGRRAGRTRGGDRQPQRLPQRDARGAATADPAARAAGLPGPARAW